MNSTVQTELLRNYGLRENPFNVTPDPRFLYESRTHREALASLAGPRRDSREIDAAATARLVATTPLAPGVLERRAPPRIPAALGPAGETVAHGERDAACDDVICGCPRHRR